MKQLNVSIALSASLLAACVSQPATQSPRAAVEPLKPYQLSASEMASVESGVRNELKDPESARFDSVVAGMSGDNIVVVCGWLNAKNSYGGYTGKKPFTGTLLRGDAGSRFVPFAFDGDEYQQRATLEKCRGNGLAI